MFWKGICVLHLKLDFSWEISEECISFLQQTREKGQQKIWFGENTREESHAVTALRSLQGEPRHTCSGIAGEKRSSQLAEDVELHKTQSLHVFVALQSSNFPFSFLHFIFETFAFQNPIHKHLSKTWQRPCLTVVTNLAVHCYLLAILVVLFSSCYFYRYFHATRHEKHHKNIIHLLSDSHHLWPFYNLFLQSPCLECPMTPRWHVAHGQLPRAGICFNLFL